MTARDLRLELRISEKERDRWQAAADAEGWTISEWLRRVADAAAKKANEKGKRR